MTSASAWLAICSTSTLLPQPAPAKMPTRWPRPHVSRPSIDAHAGVEALRRPRRAARSAARRRRAGRVSVQRGGGPPSSGMPNGSISAADQRIADGELDSAPRSRTRGARRDPAARAASGIASRIWPRKPTTSHGTSPDVVSISTTSPSARRSSRSGPACRRPRSPRRAAAGPASPSSRRLGCAREQAFTRASERGRRSRRAARRAARSQRVDSSSAATADLRASPGASSRRRRSSSGASPIAARSVATSLGWTCTVAGWHRGCASQPRRSARTARRAVGGRRASARSTAAAASAIDVGGRLASSACARGVSCVDQLLRAARAARRSRRGPRRALLDAPRRDRRDIDRGCTGGARRAAAVDHGEVAATTDDATGELADVATRRRADASTTSVEQERAGLSLTRHLARAS